jgi:CBS domain-containing protein
MSGFLRTSMLGARRKEFPMKVQDVMSRRVLTVQPGETLKEAARLLTEHRISGLPVVDGDGRVLGVISEADLLVKERGREPRRGGPLAWLIDPLDVVDRLKLDAHVVGEAMTAPALTIEPGRPVAVAAELMIEKGINRLPVVKNGELVGIVTRADLVRAFARGDEEIAREIRDDVVGRSLWLDGRGISVDVRDGEVVLAGVVDRRSDAEILPSLTERVPGVVGVESDLTWMEDDT